VFDKWYEEADEIDKYKYDRKDYLGTYNPFNPTAARQPRFKQGLHHSNG